MGREQQVQCAGRGGIGGGRSGITGWSDRTRGTEGSIAPAMGAT